MNPDMDDNQLRQRFHELKQEDARRAPSFDRVWRRAAARSETAPPARSWVRLATMAAGAMLLAAVVVWLVSGRPRTSPPGVQFAAASLADWQSPTDFLMKASDSDLLSAVPQFEGVSDAMFAGLSATDAVNHKEKP